MDVPENCWLYTQVTKKTVFVDWLLGMKCGFIIGIQKANKNLCTGNIGIPCLQTNFELSHQLVRFWQQFSGIQADCL